MTQPQIAQIPTDGACCAGQACSCAAPVAAAAEPAAAQAPEPTAVTRQLQGLPRSERRDALEALVVGEFKAGLLMTERDELPLDGSFFDLGLTSLRVTEVKQRLEQLLGCGISANVLFNRPTVSQLMTHLTDEVLVDLFSGEQGAVVKAAEAPAAESQWRDVLDELYRS